MTRALFVLAFAAILSAVGAAPVPKAVRDAPVPYFPTTVGDTLVYRTTDPRRGGYHNVVTVTEVERQRGRVVVSTESRFCDKDGEVEDTDPPSRATIAVCAQGLFDYRPPIVSRWNGQIEQEEIKDFDPHTSDWLLRTPADAGCGWRWVTRDAAPRSETRWTRTVHGPENVEVPAGTFRALRVETRVGLELGNCEYAVWYAPGLGEVKRTQGESVTVLKSFKSGDR